MSSVEIGIARAGVAGDVANCVIVVGLVVVANGAAGGVGRLQPVERVVGEGLRVQPGGEEAAGHQGDVPHLVVLVLEVEQAAGDHALQPVVTIPGRACCSVVGEDSLKAVPAPQPDHLPAGVVSDLIHQERRAGDRAAYTGDAPRFTRVISTNLLEYRYRAVHLGR